MGEILSKAISKMMRLAKKTAAPFIASISQSGEVYLRYDKEGSIYARKRNLKQVNGD